MNCCGKKENENKESGITSDPVQESKMKHKGHMSHMWMMALCCGVPIVILIIMPLLGISLFKGALLGIVPFICPIMMMIMMPMMMRKNNCDKEQPVQSEVKSIENKSQV